jgi:hypothetical protein
MTDTTERILPAVGDKVYVLPSEDDNWLGIGVEYRTVPGTVTRLEQGASPRTTIHAEFPSVNKPDDTVSFGFYNFTHAVEAGDVVKAYDVPLFPAQEGEVVTVRSVHFDPHATYPVSFAANFADVGGLSFRKAVLVKDEPQYDMSSEVDVLQSQIDELKRQLARANERVEALGGRAGKWERDFGRYSARILEEARNRDWCEEYERVMSDIEGDLEVAEIPKRSRRVSRRIRITGTAFRDVLVWVSEDDPDTLDPDDWYESEDDEEPVGDEWATDQVHSEFGDNGFDDIEFDTL